MNSESLPAVINALATLAVALTPIVLAIFGYIQWRQGRKIEQIRTDGNSHLQLMTEGLKEANETIRGLDQKLGQQE